MGFEFETPEKVLYNFLNFYYQTIIVWVCKLEKKLTNIYND